MRYLHPPASSGLGSIAALRGTEIVSLVGAIDGIERVDDLIAAGPGAWVQMAAIAATRDPAGDVDELGALAPPILAPSKIIGVGLNYPDHTSETKFEPPPEPLIFAKYPSSLVGHGSEVWWPAGLTNQVDWEGELAAVIGSTTRNVSSADAPSAVFGYTIANDISARDLQFGDVQWTRGKSLDSFCPLGPALVTADELDLPVELDIVTRVNGVDVQSDSTASMIFGIPEIIATASRAFTLNPGDLILTGTPAGCGGFRDPPWFLSAGDSVSVTIAGIGELCNPILGGR